MRKALKFTGIIGRALLIGIPAFVLVCNLYLIILSKAAGVEYPSIFGYSAAVVASGSMEPVLSVDDFIINHAQSNYETGDIITFRNGNSFTTHRIIEVTDKGYITRGDVNNTADQEPVEQNEVLGRVVAAIPLLGRFVTFLRTPVGMGVLFMAGMLMLELPFFYKNRYSSRAGRDNR